ncbi:MAG TPA: hypothetical protein VI728_13375, partial [Syntrophales bacterium]|nr:hypothetical protein [Syntrophales bacterium]
MPLLRTYTSAGALERTSDDLDLILKGLRGGWLIQGGWNILPHANLLIEASDDRKKIKAYLAEPSGNLIPYSYSHHNGKYFVFFKPNFRAGQSSGTLSAKTNPQNNLLQLNLKTGEAVLFLPDGGSRVYKGAHLYGYNPRKRPFSQHYFQLINEILPSEQRINYSYDKNKRLVRAALTNPAGTKTLAWFNVEILRAKIPYQFQIRTSDGKSLLYQAAEDHDREYLCKVESNCRPYENCTYQAGRKGTGARVHSFSMDGKLQFYAQYHLPPNKKTEEEWAEKPKKKSLPTDRISVLQAPVGPNGAVVSIAQFAYCPSYTDVRDVENQLTRFHHDSERLLLVEYFDHHDKKYSSLKFLWEGGRLRCKARLDDKGAPLFAKTFQYDALGNVVEESFWGNLTGKSEGPFTLNADGTLAGAEVLRKKYAYLPRFNVPILEEEEGGLSYKYTYKAGTDLLTAKLTCENEKILLREFFLYDNDNLLIAEIRDDGSAPDIKDLSSVTERQIKRYERASDTGLPLVVVEASLDISSGKEVLLKRTQLGYSPQNLVVSEEVYDAAEVYRYTIQTDYDAQGRIIRKTNPLGQESTSTYDALGSVLETKGVGACKKRYTYDAAGRATSCTEIDWSGKEKTTHSSYDAKGRLLSQTDAQGNTTRQIYDDFGMCLATQFPEALDQDGNAYTPIVKFTYDSQGNLASSATPQNEITQTYYNSLRKPTRIIYPDGSEIIHRYNKNGTLAKTTYSDGTRIAYLYDAFLRITAKKVFAKDG